PPPPPVQRQWPRGPRNSLHNAAKDGSAERTTALLSRGSIDIDEGDPDGWTPLIFAAGMGHSRVVVILLSRGANVSVVAKDGFTALLVSAHGGHLAATTILVKAGADLEAADARGATPLHRAAFQGCPEVVALLVEAGAKVDCRMNDGATPLFAAAHQGHAAAVRVLLRANANPLLPSANSTGTSYPPLSVAALNGHSGAVSELVQRLGIERCGGESGGVAALRLAAEKQHVDTMAILVGAGVIDPGEALMVAAEYVREDSVRFLLRQMEDKTGGTRAYASTRGSHGRTPLVSSVDAGGGRLCSPRVVRLLLDAGADSSPTFTFRNMEGSLVKNGTPLALAAYLLRARKAGGHPETDEQLRRLEAVRSLLLREKAIHAVSWLWHSDSLQSTRAANGATSAGKSKSVSTSLTKTLPILRRRARRRGALLPGFFRWAKGWC
ncbi:unnamed protein product, partial [Scytosiphon promiscuus]